MRFTKSCMKHFYIRYRPVMQFVCCLSILSPNTSHYKQIGTVLTVGMGEKHPQPNQSAMSSFSPSFLLLLWCCPLLFFSFLVWESMPPALSSYWKVQTTPTFSIHLQREMMLSRSELACSSHSSYGFQNLSQRRPCSFSLLVSSNKDDYLQQAGISRICPYHRKLGMP